MRRSAQWPGEAELTTTNCIHLRTCWVVNPSGGLTSRAIRSDGAVCGATWQPSPRRARSTIVTAVQERNIGHGAAVVTACQRANRYHAIGGSTPARAGPTPINGARRRSPVHRREIICTKTHWNR